MQPQQQQPFALAPAPPQVQAFNAMAASSQKPLQMQPAAQQGASQPQGLPQQSKKMKNTANVPASNSVLKVESGVKDIAQAKSETG